MPSDIGVQCHCHTYVVICNACYCFACLSPWAHFVFMIMLGLCVYQYMFTSIVSSAKDQTAGVICGNELNFLGILGQV